MIDGDDALAVGDADPGDLLAGSVSGDVFDGVADDHVPMDAADGSMGGVAAADLDGQADGVGGVRPIALEIGEGLVEVAGELLRPMALFAGFAGGTQVF